MPPYYDFKRNPAAVQRSLLLSPARQLGIELPALKTTPEVKEPPEVVQSTQKHETPKQVQKNVQPSKEIPSNTLGEGFLNTGMQDCSLENEQLNCTDARYFLAVNIPNNRLDPIALTEENQLAFRARRDKESVMQYLSGIYPDYINKMLFLGLGDSTLSFTKFHAIYDESLSQGEDFVARFGKMYALLKDERQKMHIKMRYQDNYPESLTQCMPISDEVIVCDNIAQNWVYRKMKE